LENRYVAAWGFKVLGRAGQPAIPKLIRLLNNPDAGVRLCATQCLESLGESAVEAVPGLISVLSLTNKNTRADQVLQACAVRALGHIGPAARAAIPCLEGISNQFGAEIALLQIRDESPMPVIERLWDRSNQRRWMQTASLVVRFGTNAEPAIPLLIAALRSTNTDLYWQAVRSLGRIHRQPELCVPVLISVLQSNSYCGDVLGALREFGSTAKPAVPHILQLFKRTDEYGRIQATNALLWIDPEAARQAGIRQP
jgi:HEAT repeat protein